MWSDWATPAGKRYTLRLLGFMALYMALLFPADAWFRSASPPTGAVRYIVAAAPALPLLGVIWAIGRYLVELTDEYVRMKLATALLWAMGLTLAVCTVWGFLENFAGVAPLPLYLVFVVFCCALGVIQGVRAAIDGFRDRER